MTLEALTGVAARRTVDRHTYNHVSVDGRVEGRLRVLRDVHSPAYQLGLDLLERPHTALLGFSPGNGYFSTKRVEIAISGFAQLSSDVTVVVPDTIAAHTHRACGSSEADTQRRVKEIARHLHRRCRKGVERAGQIAPNARRRILHWERDVWADARIARAHARVDGLFETNADFREETLALVHGVLAAKTSSLTTEALREGANYVLKELAFMSVCSSILGTDVIIPYYRPWLLGARLCEGVYDGEPTPGVGWLVYEVDLFEAPDAV